MRSRCFDVKFVSLAVLCVCCGCSGSTSSGNQTTVGGSNSTGGSSAEAATGGAADTGGTSARASSTKSSSTGGVSSVGGSSAKGSASGGASGVGGSSAKSSSVGGASSVGGSSAKGSATGGASSLGGSSAKSSSVGGASSVGGSSASTSAQQDPFDLDGKWLFLGPGSGEHYLTFTDTTAVYTDINAGGWSSEWTLKDYDNTQHHFRMVFKSGSGDYLPTGTEMSGTYSASGVILSIQIASGLDAYPELKNPDSCTDDGDTQPIPNCKRYMKQP